MSKDASAIGAISGGGAAHNNAINNAISRNANGIGVTYSPSQIKSPAPQETAGATSTTPTGTTAPTDKTTLSDEAKEDAKVNPKNEVDKKEKEVDNAEKSDDKKAIEELKKQLEELKKQLEEKGDGTQANEGQGCNGGGGGDQGAAPANGGGGGDQGAAPCNGGGQAAPANGAQDVAPVNGDNQQVNWEDKLKQDIMAVMAEKMGGKQQQEQLLGANGANAAAAGGANAAAGGAAVQNATASQPAVGAANGVGSAGSVNQTPNADGQQKLSPIDQLKKDWEEAKKANAQISEQTATVVKNLLGEQQA